MWQTPCDQSITFYPQEEGLHWYIRDLVDSLSDMHLGVALHSLPSFSQDTLLTDSDKLQLEQAMDSNRIFDPDDNGLVRRAVYVLFSAAGTGKLVKSSTHFPLDGTSILSC
jgi:hypothetical protein